MLHTHYTCIESSTSDPAALLLTSLHTHYTGIEIVHGKGQTVFACYDLHTHYTGIEIVEIFRYSDNDFFAYSLYGY